ncbi:MAG: hydrogenase small subunit [Gammaproteobacteria bacterium]
MNNEKTLGEHLSEYGVSRRTFLKFCAAMSSVLALPPTRAAEMADMLSTKPRQSVIYLSFQECTGCLESLTRSFSPTIQSLLFDVISLDYNDTLMAAAGEQAEQAREQAMEKNKGKYLVVVDGSIPTGDGGVYHTAAGHTALDTLHRVAKDAAALVAVGNCASFSGIAGAKPNPTGAKALMDIITDKPVINVPGCPPIPEVMAGTLAYVVTFGKLPELDNLKRPLTFFGNTIHDRCYRRPFYDQGKFAKTFDDEGARAGWCLYELGCKGPTTYNSCATTKWNGGVSFPIQSGHGCLGCSEPNFWDAGGFYNPLSTGHWGTAEGIALAAAGGVAVGAAAAALARARQKKFTEEENK